LPKKEFAKNKQIIASICGVSTKTIDRWVNKLFDAGLLDEGLEIIEQNGKEYEYTCYWFPYDESGHYKILDKDMVRYLVDTRNGQAIRVYLYLLSKHEWKDDYNFTLTEISQALGYSKNTDTTSIKNIIESLAREGIIRYEEIYEYIEKDGEIHKIPMKSLEFVAKTIKQLPKIK
jgi:predicted transcriptional regulator